MQDVLVVCRDHNLGALAAGLNGIGGDEVIGFGVLNFQAGHAEKRGVFLEPILLRAEVVGHFGAVLFVGGLEFRAARRKTAVPDDSGAVGLHIGEHFPEGFEESVDGVRWFASRVFKASDREE